MIGLFIVKLMKFVIYRGQKKFTIDNAVLPDFDKFEKLMDDFPKSNFRLSDLQLYDVRITSTRGLMEDMEVEDERIEKEIYEGIYWSQETVN